MVAIGSKEPNADTRCTIDIGNYAPLNEPARAGGCVLLGLRVYFSMDEGVNDRG